MAEDSWLDFMEEQMRRRNAKLLEMNELFQNNIDLQAQIGKKLDNVEAKLDNFGATLDALIKILKKKIMPADEDRIEADKAPILNTPDSTWKTWGETVIEVTTEEAMKAEKYKHDCVEGNHQEVECQMFDQSSHLMVDDLKKLNEKDSVTQLNGPQDFIIWSPEDSWDLKDHLVLNREKIDSVGSILVKETSICEINLEKFGNGLGGIVEHVLQRIHGELGVVTWEEDQKIDKAWDEEITKFKGGTLSENYNLLIVDSSCTVSDHTQVTSSYPLQFPAYQCASSKQLFTGLVCTKNVEFVDDILTFEELGQHLRSRRYHVANLTSLDLSRKYGISGGRRNFLQYFLIVSIDVVDISALASWYCEQGSSKNPIIVVSDGRERCCESVLYDFIVMVSEWAVKISIIVILGVTVSIDALRDILPLYILQYLCPSKFVLEFPVQRMDAVTASVLVKHAACFSLGHEVATFLRNYFLRQDGTLTSFIRALKMASFQCFLDKVQHKCSGILRDERDYTPRKPLSYFKERYKVSTVYCTDEITNALDDLYEGQGKPVLYLLHGLNTDSNNLSKPVKFEGIENFGTDLSTLQPNLTECRALKSHLEPALIQFANDISSAAHAQVMRNARAGMKEYQLESMFLHHTCMFGGCRHYSYTCICATGENSTVLHYGLAAAPDNRTLQDGDMALFDMGAEYYFYGSDITCSFPVNGKFTHHQSLVNNVVLDAHNVVISTMKPGLYWVDMHILTERIILEALKKGDILLGDIDDMVSKRWGAVFMPHGLWYLVGIDTHDPGGYLKGAQRPKEPGLRSLRTSRELLEGMVITVELGCYFIDAVSLPALENPDTSSMADALAVKNAESEALVNSWDAPKRQTALFEGNLASMPAYMENITRNKELTETRMMQALREELAAAQQRAEEERKHSGFTKSRMIEYLLELIPKKCNKETAKELAPPLVQENKDHSLWITCDYNFLEEVMRTWRKQSVAATEARWVDVFCQRLSLSYKILVPLHEAADFGIKDLAWTILGRSSICATTMSSPSALRTRLFLKRRIIVSILLG